MTWVLVAFVLFLLMGMPVAFAIGIAGCVFFLQHPELPSTIPIQLTVSQTQNFALLAIPLFIMAGNFLNHSGITRELLNLATVLAGRLKGGLAQVSIVLATLMGGVSGSAIADAAMQARMIGDEMLKRGFSKGYAAGVLSFGSLMTPIVPPGIGFILYGTVGQVSIGRLFAAGFLPALMLWAAMALTISITARRARLPAGAQDPAERARGRARDLGRHLGDPVPGIPAGRACASASSRPPRSAPSRWCTRSRSACSPTACSRPQPARGARGQPDRHRRGDVPDRAVRHLRLRHRVRARARDHLGDAMLGLTDDRDLVMMLIVAFILAAGCFIDGSVLIIMLTPIFLPLVQAAGVDPVHFGLIFVIAATIGNFTPPVGAAMFAVCQILKCPIGEYTRESMPFLVAVSAVTLLLIFVPEIVLWIPNLIFGKP